MSGIMDMITQQLGSSAIQTMAKKFGGGNSDGVNRMIAAAVPMILSGLKKNAGSRQGAEALAGALDKSHNGGILDNLGSLFCPPSLPIDFIYVMKPSACSGTISKFFKILPEIKSR